MNLKLATPSKQIHCIGACHTAFVLSNKVQIDQRCWISTYLLFEFMQHSKDSNEFQMKTYESNFSNLFNLYSSSWWK